MIIVIDSTEIVSDPLLRSVPWRILAQAPRRWGVRLCLTEVVLHEATAGYNRRMNDAVTGFDQWAKQAGALGLPPLVADLRQQLSEGAASAASYGRELRSKLDAIPIEVLPIPEVDHRVLIERAVNRVKPCTAKGDGYRDTLNWLSLLALAKEEDSDVLRVSNDSDFAAQNGANLHPQLQAELSEQGLGRIRLIRSLRDAALAVADQFADADGNMQDIQARLRNDALITYFRTELLWDLPSVEVRADYLALPLGAESPVLSALADITESNVEVRAPLEGQAAAVEVWFTCDTSIMFTSALETDLGADFAEVADDEGARIWEITKPVRFTALLTVDHYERPTGGEITSVRALEDDPGFALWGANGNQMVKVLVKESGPVVFTRNYVKHGVLSKRTYAQGTSGLITRIHTGPLGRITHVDVRLGDGEFVREVPIDYFRA